MATPRNTRSISQMFEGWRENLKEWVLARPKEIYESFHYKLHHLPQTNFELGNKFAHEGKLQDAAFRYKIALYLQPDFVRAHYNLACVYLRQNKHPLARQHFIAVLKLVPNHTEALFMLSALDPASVAPNMRPTHMPKGMVEDFFNGIAAQYDAMETTNEYHGGKICGDAIKLMLDGNTQARVLDLGCGTGLAVQQIRALCADITGIELAPNMAQEARLARVNDRALFDAVHEEDIAHLANSTTEIGATDIVVCCNTAQFVGDLQPLLATLGAKLKPGASVLLTVEPFNTPTGYAVNIETGRFGHHPDYVKKTAVAAGLSVKNEARVLLYPRLGAQLFLLVKAASV